MPSPTFKRLNDGWNAEPNAPREEVTVRGSTVRLTFFLNPQAKEAGEDEEGCLTFERCSMWRLGWTNDEGWYAGHCRYSEAAPAWGEFYELIGGDDLRPKPADWCLLTPFTPDQRHFLFYLRDSTFERFAAEWRFERGAPAA